MDGFVVISNYGIPTVSGSSHLIKPSEFSTTEVSYPRAILSFGNRQIRIIRKSRLPRYRRSINRGSSLPKAKKSNYRAIVTLKANFAHVRIITQVYPGRQCREGHTQVVISLATSYMPFEDAIRESLCVR